MDRLLIKMKLDRGKEVVQNWSKVCYDGEYGYMANIGKGLLLFVNLQYVMSLIDTKGKMSKRKAYKWLVKLIESDWAYMEKENCAAPFGKEYEPELPFNTDDEIVRL